MLATVAKWGNSHAIRLSKDIMQQSHLKPNDTIDFNLKSGHEIQKCPHALVVSNDAFNKLTGMTMFCPITSTHRNHPLHIELDARTQTHGDILCEQLKSLDYSARNCIFK